ncbi:MAG: tetratricopeptide repeat protein, partial [Bryobacteraceae bacterium]
MRVWAVVLSAALVWGQSVADLEAEARARPADAEAQARLGLAYRKAGRARDAVESLERSVRLDPNLRVQVLLAFSYIDAGRHGDAAPLLETSFASEKNDGVKSAIGQRLVECYLAIGSEEKALAVVEKLRAVAPDDPAVLYLASRVYMNLWNGAFQRMVAKAPGSYHVHLIQAEALEAQERYAEAAAEYRRILKIAPQVAGIHYRLGRALVRIGSDDEALRAFAQEVETNPSDAPALAQMGEIHSRKGETDEAIGRFAQAIEL